MREYDLSPLFRSVIGIDRLVRLIETAGATQPEAYPPYNIEQTGDDSFRIVMAVAGFRREDLAVTAKDGRVSVVGKAVEAKEDGVRVLHRGIARRAFERTFTLADHIKVVGASLQNGLLTVELAREIPEEQKPRAVEIAVA